MNRRMHSRLGSALAERGHRVICIDYLGHGGSDRPDDLRLYSMPLFSRQLAALIDHLELDSAVVGGTSLGANVALELAAREPHRARGLVLEMPGVDNALSAVAAFFTPVMLGLRFGRPIYEIASRVTSAIPRTHHLVDMGLDLVRQRPGPSLAVLEGLLLGETAPHREERLNIAAPTLVIGHAFDPVHPFSDAGRIVEELEDATLVEGRSCFELPRAARG